MCRAGLRALTAAAVLGETACTARATNPRAAPPPIDSAVAAGVAPERAIVATADTRPQGAQPPRVAGTGPGGTATEA